MQRNLLPWRHGFVATHHHDTSYDFLDRGGTVPGQGGIPEENGTQEPAGTVYADKACWLHRGARTLRNPRSQFKTEGACSLFDESPTSCNADLDLGTHLRPDSTAAWRCKHVNLGCSPTEHRRDKENLTGFLIYLHLDFETIAGRELQSTEINAFYVIAHLSKIPRPINAAKHVRD